MRVILTFTQRLVASDPQKADFQEAQQTLSLTAEERRRSRHPCQSDQGKAVYLNLPRGTNLQGGDRLQAETGEIMHIIAKPEPVLTVTAKTPIDLLQAAYHLGNRHVPLEITATYLRLSPDSVLQDLLHHRELHTVEEIAPFQPETGAYGHHHLH